MLQIANIVYYCLLLLQPLLSKNGVNLVGIGLEEVGAEAFIRERFLAGEVYVDLKKKCYKDLGFKRYSTYNLIIF